MATGRLIKRSGKHAYIISGPRDPLTGRYKQIWRGGFETKKAADEAMRRHLAELETNGMPVNMGLEKYLSEWLDRTTGGLAPRTADLYRRTCELYIIPHLGRVALDELLPARIEKFYAHWSKKLEPSTVHRIHRVLRAALNRALKWGYINQSPLTRVDSPSNKVGKRNTLTVDQSVMVLRWLKERRPLPYLATYMALYTGMRRAEIAGLMWSDIDWERQTLHITRNRQRINATDLIGSTKTASSDRIVPVTESVLRILREWRTKHQEHTIMRGESWSDGTYVIRHLDGTIPDPNSFTHALGDALRALELPHVSFHDLRHTHASLLLESGVDMKVVSDRLGHASYLLTADTYVHVSQRLQREAAEKLDVLLGVK